MALRPSPPAGSRTPSLGVAERRAGIILVILGLVLIAGLTLVPNPRGVQEAATTPFQCMRCGEFDAVDVLLNLALFAPLGLGLGLTGLRFPKALGILLATTCLVELLQATVILGRDSSLRDIFANTIGGALGFGLAEWWYRLLFPGARLSRRLAAAALGTWTLWWIIAALLLEVAPPPLPWWGQLAVPGVMAADFPGHLLETRFDDRLMPDSQIADAGPLERSMQSGAAHIDIVAISGGPTPALAPLFGVLNGDHKEVLLVGQAGADLVFRTRRRTAVVRLREPALRLGGGAWEQGDTIRIRASVDQDQLSLESSSPRGTLSASLALGPSLGWTLWLPGDFAFDAIAPVFSMIWIIVTLLPAAYWGRRADRLERRWQSAWWGCVVLAIAVALFGGPLLTGTSLPSVTELLGAVAGVGFGSVLAASSLERPIRLVG